MRLTSCKRWIKYCHRKHVHCVDPSISKALDFLVELYDQGIGYSAMNTARTVLRHLKTIPTPQNAPSKDLIIPNGYVNVFSFGPTWSKYTYA